MGQPERQDVMRMVVQDVVPYRHRSMGIVPSSRAAEVLVDYGEVIRSLDEAAFAVFKSLADDPKSIDAASPEGLSFGEEREHPLSRRQMLWLKFRHGVYFPWKPHKNSSRSTSV